VDAAYTTVRSAPLEVVGPAGVEARLRDGLGHAYGRLAEKPVPFATAYRELLPGGEVGLLGARVRGFAADHQDPPEQPLCLQVTGRDGRTVAFSGDTRICPGLLAAARGADLLVAECTGLRHPCGAHSTWEEWRELLPRVEARRVLLTHLGEEVRAAVPALRREAATLGGPPLDFADDGLVLEV
jgi:ribonuclease BN (tRNA processing enzyme)